MRLRDTNGVEFTYPGEKESGCGIPVLVAGKWDLFAATMKKNVLVVKKSGVDTVISSCPACDMMWRSVYPAIEYEIKARYYSEVVAEKRQNSFQSVFPSER